MTMPQPFPVNPNYQTVIRGLLRMHRLTIDGQFESPEADAIRDAMDGPWEALSDVERKRIGGLSEDLNAISDSMSAQAPLEMNPQVQEKLVQAYDARQRGEWDRALELLRRWGRYAPPALISYLRGTIWQEAGDAGTAAVFVEHACRLEPENGKYHAELLRVLKTANPAEAATRAEQILQDSEGWNPAVVVYAAAIVLGDARKVSELEALPTCRRLLPILEKTLTRLEGSEDGEGPALTGMVLSLLATCHERLGDTRLAFDYYSRATQRDPTNDTLLVARGMLVYGTSLRAAADFEQAIQLGSPLVWPYFYLAHYYLGNNRFEDCRLMCERGLRRPSSTRIKSELYEFLAMSQAGLGYPEQVIRGAFENAIRIDPSNDRARRNLERFETALSSRAPQPRDWERGSESSLRLFGQEGFWSEDAVLERREKALV
jgi:tetratricopeptide (TPR) repeat protein